MSTTETNYWIWHEQVGIVSSIHYSEISTKSQNSLHLSPTYFGFMFLCSSFHSSLSSDSGAYGERRPEREDSEDHRLRACSGMASHHKDERSGHVCLDGSRGHQSVPVLQKQRCVEVSFRPPLDYLLRPN